MGIMHPGDEVIVPANTYIASILALTENGWCQCWWNRGPERWRLMTGR